MRNMKSGDIDDLVYKIEMLRDKCRRNEFVGQIKQSELDKYSLVNFASQFYDLFK